MTRWRIPPENSCGYDWMRFSSVGNADLLEGLDGAAEGGLALESFMEFEGLGELGGDAHGGIERGHGVLENHGDLLASDAAERFLVCALRRSVSSNIAVPAWMRPGGWGMRPSRE